MLETPLFRDLLRGGRPSVLLVLILCSLNRRFFAACRRSIEAVTGFPFRRVLVEEEGERDCDDAESKEDHVNTTL